MKTDIKTIGLLTLLFSGSAFAQSTDSGTATSGASNTTEVTTSTGTETDRAAGPSAAMSASTNTAVGILVKDGKAYLLRGGQLSPVDAPLSLTVSPDGSITGFDGQTMSLPEGQMLTMDGRITAIPNPVATSTIQGLPDQAKTDAATQANEEMARANSQTPSATINVPMSGDGKMESTTSGGGGGNTNKPRRATTGSSENAGSGPR